ncbi:hypothetical protein OSB04_002906 [Centaurea solstitialis]|uniref:Uncharacterized protein n=1 Tax=Centaurea solstitialis TaxID=347529 RepID=A0AA38TTV4_9ASTR|nr:hypothetical protein OSB04_002906 [Centaurea solstitialis]
MTILAIGKPLAFFCLTFVYQINVVIKAQPEEDYSNNCDERYTYTPKSKYGENLDEAMSSLPETNSGYGFFNISVGEGPPDTANAISLCRGDVEPRTCVGCLMNAIAQIRQLAYCGNSRVVHTYNDICFLISDICFFLALSQLLGNLRGKAADGGSLLKFATGKTSVAKSSESIYALVQCTPDLSTEQYKDTSTGTTQKRAIIIPVVFVIVVVISVAMYIVWRRRKETLGSEVKKILCILLELHLMLPLFSYVVGEIMDISIVESLHYDFHTICTATNDFSENKKLGQGGFGYVYEGELPNGQAIAVKRLFRESKQGEVEFKNEVLLVAKLQHRNLVRLIGFTLEGTERLLIYEFVTNSSLDKFIFDPTKRLLLDWDTRYKIIGGIARGLLYLHEDSRLRIIHRDLKAANILLDSNMDPKIADFGMARLFNPGEIEGSTNRIVGTFGYMAPEYALYGQFSVKSDVFSFGVLVLEIVVGQRNQRFRTRQGFEGLLTYAWKCLQDGTVSSMLDPTLKKISGSLHEMIRTIHIGLLCVQNNVADRPTMAEVVHILKSASLPLPKPLEPAFFMHTSVDEQMPNPIQYHHFGNNEGSQFSMNDVTVTDIVPR